MDPGMKQNAGHFGTPFTHCSLQTAIPEKRRFIHRFPCLPHQTDNPSGEKKSKKSCRQP
jgi:hypothetical protein